MNHTRKHNPHRIVHELFGPGTTIRKSLLVPADMTVVTFDYAKKLKIAEEMWINDSDTVNLEDEP